MISTLRERLQDLAGAVGLGRRDKEPDLRARAAEAAAASAAAYEAHVAGGGDDERPSTPAVPR